MKNLSKQKTLSKNLNPNDSFETLSPSRRDFLKFLGGSAAFVTMASPLNLAAQEKAETIQKKISKKIKGLKANLMQDELILAEGLNFKILIKTGEQLSKDIFFGTNNDFTQVIKLKDGKFGLWVNHEAFTSTLVSNRVRSEVPTKEQYANEKTLLGGSFFEIKQNQDQIWEVVKDSKYNFRLSGDSKIPFANNVKIGNSKHAIGTFANCSGGLTPWNTILTCEENYQHYYGEYDRKLQKAVESPKGVLWNRLNPLDPRHYGWVVEYNPETKNAKKLTGIGRFSHECAKPVMNKDGYPVVYSGDDSDNECLYKFVSKNKNNLDEGELFVASLEKRQWLSLDITKNPRLKEAFKDQTEVLTFCREASKIVGATPLARPEDIEIDPFNGHVLIALTNNKTKDNHNGSILKIIEPDNNYSSTSFEFETFLTGGKKSGISCPDNLAFDRNGNLWITSDMPGNEVDKGPLKGFGNNGLFVVPRTGPDAGKVIQVASAPNDAELTGPCFSPDYKTLFLSVQHPGELSKKNGPYTSHWPEGKPDSKPLSAVVTISGPLIDMLTS